MTRLPFNQNFDFNGTCVVGIRKSWLKQGSRGVLGLLGVTREATEALNLITALNP